MRAYTHIDAKIGPKRSFTPEGFLFCEDVALARTGIQVYLPSEIEGIPPGPDGLIHVERKPEDVFTEKALASFVAKPVTDNHPSDNLNPKTYRSHSRGTILNPRRGTGDQSDLMVGDLLVCDHEAIQAILDGKREVSCGYSAEYEIIGPGRARQHDIIGNHVALVAAGRCGGRCAIGDEDTIMAESAARTKLSNITWKDKAKAAAVIGDMDTLDAALAEAGGASSSQPTINITLGDLLKAQPKAKTKDAKGDDDEDEDEDEDDKKKKDTSDALSKLIAKAVKDGIAPVLDRIAKLEKGRKTKDTESAKPDDDEDEDGGNKAKNGEDDEEKSKRKEASDARPYTKDQLPDVIQDLNARAEILMPGIRLPALDAKGDPVIVSKGICDARRNALTAALMLDKSKAAIQPLLAGQPSFDKMTCDQLAVVFTAASENMKLRNNVGSGGSQNNGGVRKIGDKEFSGMITPAEINAKNREFHKQKSS